MIDPPMLVDEDEVHKEMIESKNVETRGEKAKDRVSDEMVRPKKLKSIPRPQPSFPQRFKKNEEEGKFQYFISMLKQLSINIPVFKVLERMSRYVKFMKDLLMKKRTIS